MNNTDLYLRHLLLSEKRTEKIECECGSVTRKADMSKHLKTKRHHNHTITTTHKALQPITTA